jgi:hypothetical protein
VVVLNELVGQGDTHGGMGSAAVGLDEKATLVTMRLRCNQPWAPYSRGNDLHISAGALERQ